MHSVGDGAPCCKDSCDRRGLACCACIAAQRCPGGWPLFRNGHPSSQLLARPSQAQAGQLPRTAAAAPAPPLSAAHHQALRSLTVTGSGHAAAWRSAPPHSAAHECPCFCPNRLAQRRGGQPAHTQREAWMQQHWHWQGRLHCRLAADISAQLHAVLRDRELCRVPASCGFVDRCSEASSAAGAASSCTWSAPGRLPGPSSYPWGCT